MKRLEKRVIVAFVSIFGGLVACNCAGVFQAPKAPAEPVYEPAWIIETGLLSCLKGSQHLPTGPNHVIVSRDGKYLLTFAMSNDENIQVWDLATKKKVHAFKNFIGTMHAHIAIAHDSRTAACTQLSPGGIIIFDLVTGNKIRTILDDAIYSYSPYESMQFAPDGSLLLLACKGRIIGWDPATGLPALAWQANARCLSPFFEDGAKIASSDGARVSIWDVKQGKAIKTFGPLPDVPIMLTKDERKLISGATRDIKVFDVATGELDKAFDEYFGTYPHIVPFPDNRTAAWPTNDGFIIYDWQARTRKQMIKTNEPYITGLALTPDGTTLITAATDGLIKGWRLNADGIVE